MKLRKLDPGGVFLPKSHQLQLKVANSSFWQALQQCGREELVELVLPQLAQVVTLYELAVKVSGCRMSGQRVS